MQVSLAVARMYYSIETGSCHGGSAYKTGRAFFVSRSFTEASPERFPPEVVTTHATSLDEQGSLAASTSNQTGMQARASFRHQRCQVQTAVELIWVDQGTSVWVVLWRDITCFLSAENWTCTFTLM